jgi:glucokinase
MLFAPVETKWMTENCSYDRIILAGDVGGTNTNIAFLGNTGKDFTIIMECVFSTPDVLSFPECLKTTLQQARQKIPELTPDICCISGAGPVKDNYCTLSNTKCDIDGDQIEKALDVRTLIINDFSAISYSLPLMDVNNSEQITCLRHLDGSVSEQRGHMMAVAGAGTGMGVGFLIEKNEKYTAYPSEGGHISFASFDEETRQFYEFMVSRIGELTEAELFVCGGGIASLFDFFKEVKKVPIEGVLAQIDKADESEKPAMISKCADQNSVCREIFKLFVKMYGRFAGDVSSLLIPTMGMYLAGGIVTKNEKYFLEDDLFMRYFEGCYHPNIQKVLKTIPVYIIKDYSVSLYGAANAACSLM